MFQHLCSTSRAVVLLAAYLLVQPSATTADEQGHKGKDQGKNQPAAARNNLADFLPLVEAKDKNKLNDREREILKKLANGKVPTVDKAKNAAQQHKFKASGILAEEAPHVVSLLPLGIDVPDFGKRGELVWVVQFRVFHGAITQEVWVNSNSSGVLAILPLKR